MISCNRTKLLHYQDEETKKRYHAVGQVIEVLYGNRFQFANQSALKIAQERGIRRHILFGCLLLWKAGLVDKPIIEARDNLAANGLVNWMIERHVRVVKVEEPSINLRDGYAGCPDAKILYGEKRIVCIPDLKTGGKSEAHAIQVQAYNKLDGYTDVTLLMDLYVDDDGRVTESLVTPNPHDWAWFLSGLGVLKGRNARGIK